MRRILLAVAVLAIPASAATMGLSSAAWASGGTSCSGLSGNVVSGGTGSLSGCTDTANTGGSGSFPIAAFTSGSGTITWATGGTTNVKIKAKAVKKDEKESQSCPVGDTEYAVSGKVTGSTGAGKSVKGKVKGEVCLDSSGNLSVEPGTVLKF